MNLDDIEGAARFRLRAFFKIYLSTCIYLCRSIAEGIDELENHVEEKDDVLIYASVHKRYTIDRVLIDGARLAALVRDPSKVDRAHKGEDRKTLKRAAKDRQRFFKSILQGLKLGPLDLLRKPRNNLIHMDSTFDELARLGNQSPSTVYVIAGLTSGHQIDENAQMNPVGDEYHHITTFARSSMTIRHLGSEVDLIELRKLIQQMRARFERHLAQLNEDRQDNQAGEMFLLSRPAGDQKTVRVVLKVADELL